MLKRLYLCCCVFLDGLKEMPLKVKTRGKKAFSHFYYKTFKNNNNFGFHVHFQPCCFLFHARDQYILLNGFNTQSYGLISLASRLEAEGTNQHI